MFVFPVADAAIPTVASGSETQCHWRTGLLESRHWPKPRIVMAVAGTGEPVEGYGDMGVAQVATLVLVSAYNDCTKKFSPVPHQESREYHASRPSGYEALTQSHDSSAILLEGE